MTSLDKILGLVGGGVCGHSYDLYSKIMKSHENLPLKYSSEWYGIGYNSTHTLPILGEETPTMAVSLGRSRRAAPSRSRYGMES